QNGGLVRIVAQADGGEQDFVKESPVAILRIHGQAAAEQAQSVAVVDVAAVHSAIAVGQRPAVSCLERVGDVVVPDVLSADRSHRLCRGRHHLLRLQQSGGGNEV